jgi:hypothetical protein
VDAAKPLFFYNFAHPSREILPVVRSHNRAGGIHLRRPPRDESIGQVVRETGVRKTLLPPRLHRGTAELEILQRARFEDSSAACCTCDLIVISGIPGK